MEEPGKRESEPKSMAGEQGRINLKLKFRSACENDSASPSFTRLVASGAPSSGAAALSLILEPENAFSRTAASLRLTLVARPPSFLSPLARVMVLRTGSGLCFTSPAISP